MNLRARERGHDDDKYIAYTYVRLCAAVSPLDIIYSSGVGKNGFALRVQVSKCAPVCFIRVACGYGVKKYFARKRTNGTRTRDETLFYVATNAEFVRGRRMTAATVWSTTCFSVTGALLQGRRLRTTKET